MTVPKNSGKLKCGHCGRLNAPGTRLCTRCRFVLRGNEEPVIDYPDETSPAPVRRARHGMLYRVRHDRRSAVYAAAVAAMIVAVSVAVYYELHKDDPSPTALLYYRYVAPTDTSGGMVRVWGDVHNWGGSGGTVFVDVQISDEAGHSSAYVIDLGQLPADGGVDVDELLDWPHPCLSTLDLTMTYGVGYESDWWF